MAEKAHDMKKTNFDRYLAEQMKGPAFAARFKQAGEAWDVALQLTALREQAGLSQAELARKLKTSAAHANAAIEFRAVADTVNGRKPCQQSSHMSA